MSSDLVLITGATGHVGFRVLVVTLEAGYRVRAAVRNQEKADTILAAPSIKALNPGSRLTFTFVPDILADGAFDEAVKGVDSIIHIASPIVTGIPSDKFETHLIQPAVKGTTGILYSAKSNPNIRRIVITSSEVAVIPWEPLIAVETGDIFTDSNRIQSPIGPYGSEFEAYAASKAIALNKTEEFIQTEKPSFDVINVMPSYVIGKNELVTDAKNITVGTNGAAFGPVLGVDAKLARPGTTVHLDDVARVHVLALDPKIPGNQSFFLNSEGLKGTIWEDAIDIVASNFPEAVKKGVLPNNGKAPTKSTKIDARRTEEVFGFKFKSYEEQVLSVTRHYLELIGF